MAVNPKEFRHPYYTLEEYFALEGAGHARYEYWNGEMVCMSGGTEQHIRISGNVYYSLRKQLGAVPCEAFNSELPIKTPALPPYRYVDASVVCGKPALEKIEGFDVLTNPTLIVEVLSPTTESRDRKEKRAAHQSLSSLMEYLLVAQDVPHITHYLRQEGSWARSDYGDLKATVLLPSIDCVLALSDAYQGVEFG
jgi:Uma2 family endonuclease